ncbi:FAD-dependent oxidoreductase [Bacillus sp. FSL W7-1360]
MTFSYKDRQDALEQMGKEQLDLLVIGGGITGVGIALDATTRGISTGLLEMQDFAAGTSSRSTKLIHGGLRYLKQFEVKLVAEVGKERAVVYENAPHVTTPVRMMLPFYQGGTFNALTTSVGLAVYDRLAGVKKSERRTMLKAKAAGAQESLLRQEGLKGAGMYVEYRTDDARLTLEVAKTAADRGAKLANYVEVTSFLYEESRLVGVVATDRIKKKQMHIYAKKIVNATGPWVDRLREWDHSKKDKTIHLTKGVHLVFSRRHFPLNQALYFDTPFQDGRMMFAIPRGEKVYIGTTDTNYDGDQQEPGVTKEDVDYILRATNGMFPGQQLTIAHIESSWAGLRPLIHEEGKDPSDISRKDEIFHSKSGLMTIAGGKLTGYRKMADTIVTIVADALSKETGHSYGPCQTKSLALSGGEVGGADAFNTFKEKQIALGKTHGLDEKTARTLVERYGSNVPAVYAYLNEKERELYGLDKQVWAALRYAIAHELALTPVDFLLRRTAYMLFDIGMARTCKAGVVKAMSVLLHWTAEEQKHYEKELDAKWQLLTLEQIR